MLKRLKRKTKKSRKLSRMCCRRLKRPCKMNGEMYEKTLAITQLIETLKFDRVGHHVALPRLEFFLPMYVVASKSSTFALNEIMEALEDDEINMIGV
ncbi:hypothetical protein Gotri_011122 [Gossypium trilobum]|uniref:Uncharacterized protein n=1 Tax=Gossypium trilobum TaxID=34281 RepID=A0A7J9ET79_9ROSI|nr:hypothetical protein [Gossypium trilobum]